MSKATMKAREIAAGIFALALVVILVAVGAAVFGIRLPILSSLTDMIGLGGG